MASARLLNRGADPHRLGAYGVLVGIVAFTLVALSAPLGRARLFSAGAVLIGFGGGLFVVATLIAAMALAERSRPASRSAPGARCRRRAAGLAIAIGGVLRDVVGELAASGALGTALTDPSVGYSVVYQLEIALLFATLVAIGPLARYMRVNKNQHLKPFGLAALPN